MWAKNTASVLSLRLKHTQQTSLLRSLSTASVSNNNDVSSSPIADDGRHELWREGQSSDHDNEPRYVVPESPVHPSNQHRIYKILQLNCCFWFALCLTI